MALLINVLTVNNFLFSIISSFSSVKKKPESIQKIIGIKIYKETLIFFVIICIFYSIFLNVSSANIYLIRSN